MKKIYPLEPVMHAGKNFMPGEVIEADQYDLASLIHSGRCTFDTELAKEAARRYTSAQQLSGWNRAD